MAKSRYIDANKIDFKIPCEWEHEECFVSMDDVRKAIAQTPTEDVVEVVRCKDCISWQRNIGLVDSPNGHCFYLCMDTNQFDFCSYGEKALKEREKE
jgi:hypothetical protein